MKGRKNEKGYLKPCSSPSRRSLLDVHRRMALGGRCRSSALQLEDNWGDTSRKTRTLQEQRRDRPRVGKRSVTLSFSRGRRGDAIQVA